MMPTIANPTIHEELQDKVGEGVLASQSARDGIPTFWVTKENIHGLLRYLKNEIPQPYRMLYDLSAIDEREKKYREGQPDSDFTVVYHLLSFDRNEYVRVKVPLKSDHLALDIATDIWAAANWYEREIWDMFGIVFENHPHLTRILMRRPGLAIHCVRIILRGRLKWVPSTSWRKNKRQSRRRCVSVRRIGE